jgi:hypothetical protein
MLVATLSERLREKLARLIGRHHDEHPPIEDTQHTCAKRA